MKALELVIYPKSKPIRFHYGADPSAEYRRTRKLIESKRLTDPELAAEFEAARCDYLLSQQSGHFWAPLGETWPSDHESAGRRTTTLLRFATLPHYDEDQP